MKQKPLQARLIMAVLIGMISLPSPVQAKLQADPIEHGSVAQSRDDFWSQAQDIVAGVRDFVTGIPHFLSRLPQEIQGMLGGGSVGDFGLPDFAGFIDQIESGSTLSHASTRMAELLEGRQFEEDSPGSFAIRQDAANDVARQVTEGAMSAATLSKEAQTTMKQRARQAAAATQHNQHLAQNSQSSDVTQHIMQNLSEQTALNAQLTQQLLQEEQQARIDRAINNMLTVQVAEGIAEANTADRREAISTNNRVISSTGLISMPGGFTLEQE